MASTSHHDIDGSLGICLSPVLVQEQHVSYCFSIFYILILADVLEQKQVTGRGNVIVSSEEDQRSKWEDTLTCDTGSVAYRKGHLISLLLIITSDDSPIRILDIDTLNGHLNITSSNRDSINTKLHGTSSLEKTRHFAENVDDKALIKYDYFINSRFHASTSLSSQKSIVSNFGQYNDQQFWQMTTDLSFTIEYDRVKMKPLKHQWNKMLGPISLSGVDLFNIQYDCINGNLTSVYEFKTTY